MKSIKILGTVIAGLLLLSTVVWAQTQLETYIYGRSPATTPYPCNSSIPVVPTPGATNSLLTIPACALLDTAEIGWNVGTDPGLSPIVSGIVSPIEVTAISGMVANPVGGSGDTVQVNALAGQSGNCSAGSNLATGTFNADASRTSNPQTLTLTSPVNLQTGSTICIVTNGPNWGSTSNGIGGIHVEYIVLPTSVGNCTISGSTTGPGDLQACTQVTYTVAGDSGPMVWTACGTGNNSICRAGVQDTGISGSNIVLLYNTHLYFKDLTNNWHQWNNPPTWPGGYTSLGANDPRLN